MVIKCGDLKYKRIASPNEFCHVFKHIKTFDKSHDYSVINR
jgi:hypothetical protein